MGRPGRRVHRRRRRRRARRHRSVDRGCSTPGAFVRVGRLHQGAGRRPARRGRRRSSRADFAARRTCPLDEVNVNLVSSSWGAEITTKALEALADLPRDRGDLHLDPVRVADGAGGDRRDGARRVDQRRHLLDLPVHRHAADRDRLPDDPRLLALRHDRRVRPGPGERGAVRRPEAAVRRHHQRVDEPGVDALAHHELLVDRAGRSRCC